jgi:hypothetical protein
MSSVIFDGKRAMKLLNKSQSKCEKYICRFFFYSTDGYYFKNAVFDINTGEFKTEWKFIDSIQKLRRLMPADLKKYKKAELVFDGREYLESSSFMTDGFAFVCQENSKPEGLSTVEDPLGNERQVINIHSKDYKPEPEPIPPLPKISQRKHDKLLKMADKTVEKSLTAKSNTPKKTKQESTKSRLLAVFG